MPPVAKAEAASLPTKDDKPPLYAADPARPYTDYTDSERASTHKDTVLSESSALIDRSPTRPGDCSQFWTGGLDEAEEKELDAAASPSFSIVWRALFWVGLLLAQFTISRGWCVWGHLPSDCNRNWDSFDMAENMVAIGIYGFVLGAAAEIFHPERFEYMVRQRYLLMVMLVVSPCMSLINQLPVSFGTFSSHTSGGDKVGTIIMLSLGCGILAVIAWHLNRCGIEQLPAYLAPRLGVAALYGSAAALVISSGGEMHLHHYFIGWYFGLYCKFNHPVSAVCLAICVGLFVQGIAAYNAAPLFSRGACYYFAESTGNLHNKELSPSDPDQRLPVSSFSCSVTSPNPVSMCLDGYSSSIYCNQQTIDSVAPFN